MSIEGVLQAEQLRDYLYAEMRGAKSDVNVAGVSRSESSLDSAEPEDEALALLREIRDECLGQGSDFLPALA